VTGYAKGQPPPAVESIVQGMVATPYLPVNYTLPNDGCLQDQPQAVYISRGVVHTQAVLVKEDFTRFKRHYSYQRIQFSLPVFS